MGFEVDAAPDDERATGGDPPTEATSSTGGGAAPSSLATNEPVSRGLWQRLRLRRSDILLLIVPVLVGALLGWLGAAGPAPSYRATALINAAPGVTNVQSLDVPPDIADRTVQTELVIVNTLATPMAAAMTQASGNPSPPPVTASQVAGTSVISFAVSDPDPAEASAMANAAASVYVEDWRRRTGQEAQNQLAALDATLAAIRERIAAVPEGPTQQSELDALNAQYQNLSVTRAETALAVNDVADVDRVVQAATEQGAVRTSSPLRSAALGGLLGLLVGVALLLWRRQRRRNTAP